MNEVAEQDVIGVEPRGNRRRRFAERRNNIRARQIAAKVLEILADGQLEVLTPEDPTGEGIKVKIRQHHGKVHVAIDRLSPLEAHVFDHSAEELKGTNSVNNLSRVLRQNEQHVEVLARRFGIH
jgi:hypothetical protein